MARIHCHIRFVTASIVLALFLLVGARFYTSIAQSSNYAHRLNHSQHLWKVWKAVAVTHYIQTVCSELRPVNSL